MERINKGSPAWNHFTKPSDTSGNFKAKFWYYCTIVSVQNYYNSYEYVIMKLVEI